MTTIISVYFTNTTNTENELFGTLDTIPYHILNKIKSKCLFIEKFKRDVYTFRSLEMIIQNNIRSVNLVKYTKTIQLPYLIQVKEVTSQNINSFPMIANYSKVSNESVTEYSIKDTKLYLIEDTNTNIQYLEIYSDNIDLVNLFI